MQRIGLALSGGGYRATLFAAGSLLRLNEWGMLPAITTITSVSGGAISAGYLACKWDKLEFLQQPQAGRPAGYATNLQQEVIQPLLDFCRVSIDRKSVLKGLFSIKHTIGDKVSACYDKHLYQYRLLSSVAQKPNAPEFVFYGTNYATGVSVQISKDYLMDYRIGKATNHQLSVAKVVGVSSAFPPFFAPIVLDGSGWDWQREPYSDLFDQAPLRQKLVLCDGGLYDNMGIEKLWKTNSSEPYDAVLVCDSGAPLQVPYPYSAWRKNWLNQFLRMNNIMINQQRALRKRQLIANYKKAAYQGTYWGIDTKIDEYPCPNKLMTDSAQTDSLSDLPTQLRPFDMADQGRLIKWAYALTDAALRSYYDKHLAEGGQLP